MYQTKTLLLIFVVFLSEYPTSYGIPTGPVDPASAADPSTNAAPPPEAVAAPPPPAATSPSAPAPSQQSPGSGLVTEHKNPDGSTITITRFNGPLPSSVFQSPIHSDMGRLHDVFLQAQLIQLQTQQAINQALLRNMQLYSFPSFPTYPYIYPGQFLNPFNPYGFGYPFFPYGGGQAPASRTIK